MERYAPATKRTIKPRVQAILPGLIPSTLIGVVKPLIGLHRLGRVEARIALEGSIARRDIEKADLLIFCRNLEPQFAWTLDLAKSRSKPYIYVLDDNLFDVPLDSDVGLYHSEPRRLQQLREYIAGADLVNVYSAALAHRLRAINARVEIVQPSIDFGLTEPARRLPRRGSVKIVFATSRSQDNLASLFVEDLALVLDRSGRQVEAWFWGSLPPRLAGHPSVHFVQFTPDYDRFLRKFSRCGFDIGLAPLVDDEFHRSKTNNKLREYGACRIAGIYSDVHVYTSCIQDGVTGLIVSDSPGAWHDAILRLMKDPGLRESIQEEAYRFVRRRYSLESARDALWQQIEKVLSQDSVIAGSDAPTRQVTAAPKAVVPGEQPRARHRFFVIRVAARLKSVLARLKSMRPAEALATLKRRWSQRCVLWKIRLATSPLGPFTGRARRRRS